MSYLTLVPNLNPSSSLSSEKEPELLSDIQEKMEKVRASKIASGIIAAIIIIAIILIIYSNISLNGPGQQVGYWIGSIIVAVLTYYGSRYVTEFYYVKKYNIEYEYKNYELVLK